MNDYPYYFAWKNNPKRATLYKRELKVLARGAMNSALVEFENGQREVISRNALRRRTKLAIDPASASLQPAESRGQSLEQSDDPGAKSPGN